MLTGARDGALATLKLKHIDMGECMIDQDGREVHTKRSKTIQTWFFPVGSMALDIARKWVEIRYSDHLAEQHDALFPKTRIARDTEGYFRVTGLERGGWANAQPIRKVFKAAFEQVGLPPINPHSVRDMLAQLGEKLCRTPEEFKAWSQNLGHSGVLTTFNSYGSVSSSRQAEIIRSLDGSMSNVTKADDIDIITDVVDRLRARNRR